LGVVEHRDTIRKGSKLFYEYLNAGWIKEPDGIDLDSLENSYKPSEEYNKDGSITYDKLITICENQDMTPEFLLEAHGLDKDKWEVVWYKNNYWHSQVKGGKRLVMYQSKITVKPKILKFSPDWVKETLENLNLSSPYVKRKNYKTIGKTLEVNIADAHINKLACINESNNEYSLDIGINNLHGIIEDVIQKTKYYDFKKIIFPFGQDIANIDNMFGTTTKGTPQDWDKKYPDMYQRLLEASIQIVYKLSDIAPVEVIYVGGNHDKLTSFTMTMGMYWHFLNNKNVEVDYSFKRRKYRLIGNNLLGLGHGEEEKKRIYYCMQNDVPDLWGRAKYREFHLSHLHSEKLIDELNGTIFRWLSSPSPNDTWTYNSGFVGAQKKAQCFIWDDEGLEAIINCYVSTTHHLAP